MNDERHTDDLETMADWFRTESPEVSGLDMDRIKRRAMAQAARRTPDSRPASLAGRLFSRKGLLMGKRPRPLMTVFLVLGLLVVLAVPAIYATGQLPTLGGFDAAQTQYDDDDDGGSSNRSDDDDDGGDEDSGPRPIVGYPGRNDCVTFDGQNFTSSDEATRCSSSSLSYLSGQVGTPEQACAGFSTERPTGNRRSDYDACVLALRLAYQANQPKQP